MNIKLGLCVAALTSIMTLTACAPIIVGAAAGGAAAGNAGTSSLSLGTQVEDTTIKTKALGRLNDFPQLKADTSNVEIAVFNRTVLLVGQVPTKELKHQVAEKMANIDGVRMVYNQLAVGKAVTVSGYSQDGWITTKIKTQMIGKVNPSQFKVVTENGVVYIMALTDPASGSTVSNLAKHTQGVRKVVEAYTYGTAKHAPAKIEEKTPNSPLPASKAPGTGSQKAVN